MALIKWEPSESLATLRREVDRLFEDFFDGGSRHFWGHGTAPAVEVCDTKDAVVVKAQVPGVSKDQLQVDITDDTLTLKGARKEEEKQEDKNFYRREFHYGAFTRTMALPMAVQADKATAQLKDGVLEITLPKSASAQAKVKQIPIQVS
jgi:HSP20 family protein